MGLGARSERLCLGNVGPSTAARVSFGRKGSHLLASAQDDGVFMRVSELESIEFLDHPIIITPMTTEQFIAEFKTFSLQQRRQIIEAIVREDDSWVPDSFRQGMKDIEEGRVVNMEAALYEELPGT